MEITGKNSHNTCKNTLICIRHEYIRSMFLRENYLCFRRLAKGDGLHLKDESN